MHHLWQHIETILAGYDGGLPLHHFLKDYFKRHPKLGSRDRRGISDAVYSWYRAGKMLSDDAHEAPVKVLAAMYLCGLRPKAFTADFPVEWLGGSDATKLQEYGFPLHPENIFPYNLPFSAGITPDEWRASMLRQPRLFLRIRKDKADISDTIQKSGIPHEWLSDTCLALPNGTNLEGLLPADTYVVQDASSQATGKYLRASPGERWWDACSGAGGKSLLLKDAAPKVNLLATDIRPGILHNLKERFRLYGHAAPETAVLDASDGLVTQRQLDDRRFDGIICDVPCSGSGTWARTPESCYFFKRETVAQYAARQRAILANAGKYLAEGGRIVYITCSVFRAENEEVIEAVAAEQGLEIVAAGLISGLDIGADALFAAELRHGAF